MAITIRYVLQNIYSFKHFRVGGYPYLFPYGFGGAEEDRKVKLSLDKWIRHLLKFHDPRFRKDKDFLFHVFNVLQKRQVVSFI